MIAISWWLLKNATAKLIGNESCFIKILMTVLSLIEVGQTRKGFQVALEENDRCDLAQTNR